MTQLVMYRQRVYKILIHNYSYAKTNKGFMQIYNINLDYPLFPFPLIWWKKATKDEKHNIKYEVQHWQ